MPGSSQSGSMVGLMLSVQVERISTPRTASRAESTGDDFDAERSRHLVGVALAVVADCG